MGKEPWNKGLPMTQELKNKLSQIIGNKKGFVTPINVRIRRARTMPNGATPFTNEIAIVVNTAVCAVDGISN
jgi:hypothetical protein